MASDSPSVLVEREDAVATITLHRPDRRNGVTIEMCEALYDAVRDVAASDARVLILRGAAGISASALTFWNRVGGGLRLALRL